MRIICNDGFTTVRKMKINPSRNLRRVYWCLFIDVRRRNITEHYFCNTAIRTLHFLLSIRISHSYLLNVVRPVRISVSIGCC